MRFKKEDSIYTQTPREARLAQQIQHLMSEYQKAVQTQRDLRLMVEDSEGMWLRKLEAEREAHRQTMVEFARYRAAHPEVAE